MVQRPAILRSVPVVVLLAATGCRSAPVVDGILSLDDAPRAAPLDAASRRPVARTLPVEVFFLRCPADAGGEVEAMWNRIDEQAIDAPLRRRLAENGLRAGILRDGIPDAVLAGLEPPLSGADETTEPTPNAADATPPVVRRVLRLLPGRESEVVSLKALPDLVVMERDEDGLHGATYSDALPHVVLRAWPAADGRLRLDLVPVIRHGPIERAWVGEEGAFKIETGQRRHVIEDLRLEAIVPADGMLVVGPAGESAGTVGDALFRPRQTGRACSRLLAMRPLSAGVDPMFAPGGDASEPDAEPPPAVTTAEAGSAPRR